MRPKVELLRGQRVTAATELADQNLADQNLADQHLSGYESAGLSADENNRRNVE